MGEVILIWKSLNCSHWLIFNFFTLFDIRIQAESKAPWLYILLLVSTRMCPLGLNSCSYFLNCTNKLLLVNTHETCRYRCKIETTTCQILARLVNESKQKNRRLAVMSRRVCYFYTEHDVKPYALVKCRVTRKHHLGFLRGVQAIYFYSS